MTSEDIKKLENVSTKDVTELIELVLKLMEEYNKQISQVNNYYRTLYGQQIMSIPTTSSIPQ